jgi:hypothetical protein
LPTVLASLTPEKAVTRISRSRVRVIITVADLHIFTATKGSGSTSKNNICMMLRSLVSQKHKNEMIFFIKKKYILWMIPC